MTESAALVLADLPYAERQLIVVVDDALVAAEREAEKEGEPGTGRASSVEIANVAALAIAPSRWQAARVRIAGIAGLTEHKVASAVATALAAARARDSGVDVLTVASTEAASLTFPPGHPRDRVLYVGHPAVPTTYYAAAGFHRHTFEHKFAEAVGLVMDLGATQLEVEHVKGWSDALAANLAVPLPMAGAAEAGLDAERSRSHGSSALFKASLKGNANPKLPDGLVWFPHEPTWQQLAEGRLRHGLTQFQLSVRYEDDYGIDAGLKLNAGKAGLDLGGSFEEHESTVWRIEGNFAE